MVKFSDFSCQFQLPLQLNKARQRMRWANQLNSLGQTTNNASWPYLTTTTTMKTTTTTTTMGKNWIPNFQYLRLQLASRCKKRSWEVEERWEVKRREVQPEKSSACCATSQFPLPLSRSISLPLSLLLRIDFRCRRQINKQTTNLAGILWLFRCRLSFVCLALLLLLLLLWLLQQQLLLLLSFKCHWQRRHINWPPVCATWTSSALDFPLTFPTVSAFQIEK